MPVKLSPEALRAARALKGWSTREAAKRLGVAVTTLNAIENGRAPRPSKEAAIIAAFELEGVEILNGDRPGARLLGTP